MSEKKILLVEDDRDDIDLFCMIAKELDSRIQIISIDDPVDLNRTLEETPDLSLVVIDMKLPGKTGKEILEKFRSYRRYDQVPVVMLTGNADQRMIDQCMAAGASVCYLKSGNFYEMTNIIHKIFDLRLTDRVHGWSPSFFSAS